MFYYVLLWLAHGLAWFLGTSLVQLITLGKSPYLTLTTALVFGTFSFALHIIVTYLVSIGGH
jgi:hypothetical protein